MSFLKAFNYGKKGPFVGIILWEYLACVARRIMEVTFPTVLRDLKSRDQFWALHDKKEHGGAGACPGMGMDLGKGLEHQEQLGGAHPGENGALGINKLSLRLVPPCVKSHCKAGNSSSILCSLSLKWNVENT